MTGATRDRSRLTDCWSSTFQFHGKYGIRLSMPTHERVPFTHLVLSSY